MGGGTELKRHFRPHFTTQTVQNLKYWRRTLQFFSDLWIIRCLLIIAIYALMNTGSLCSKNVLFLTIQNFLFFSFVPNTTSMFEWKSIEREKRAITRNNLEIDFELFSQWYILLGARNCPKILRIPCPNCFTVFNCPMHMMQLDGIRVAGVLNQFNFNDYRLKTWLELSWKSIRHLKHLK